PPPTMTASAWVPVAGIGTNRRRSVTQEIDAAYTNHVQVGTMPASLDTGMPAMHQFAPRSSSGTSAFPPIADYGFLSDCEPCALIAPTGNVEWLCLPRFDSPSVFGAILDRDAGRFRIGPDGVEVPVARRYLPGTMVLETSWGAPGGWLV